MTHGKIEGIQVARALAAISVLLHHSNLMINAIPDKSKFLIPFFYNYGGVGVQLFFVISGFIIAKVIDTPRIDMLGFFIKRVIRIYPIYWIATLFALYLHTVWSISFHRDASHAFILQSLMLWPIPGTPFFQVGWTLEHEMVFYLIAGLLGPLLGVRVVMYALIALGAASLVFRATTPGLWGYNVLSYLNIFFAAGMALHIYRRQLESINWRIPAVAAASTLTIYTYYIPNISGEPRLYFQLITLIIASLAICICLMNMPPQQNKIWRALVWTGNISFSLYLAHWIVYRVIRQYQREPFFFDNPELLRWLGIACSFALAWLMFRLIEHPINHFGQRLAARPASAKSLIGPRSAPLEGPQTIGNTSHLSPRS